MRHSSETQIIGFCLSAHASAHICEQIFPAIAPILVERGFADLSRIGDLGTVFPIFFGFLALPAGFLVDKYGSRRVLYTFLVGAGLAAIAASLSTGLTSLAVSMGMMGMAAALYHPAGLALLSKGVSQSGKAFGLHGVGGSIGLALGPILAGWVGATFDWRYGFLVAAAPCLILAMYAHRHDLGETTATTPETPPPTPGDIASTGDNPTDAHSTDINHGPAVLVAPIALLLAMGLFNGLAYRGFLTFLPLYMTDHFQQSLFAVDPIKQANTLVSVALFAGMWGQYVGGHLADRYTEQRLIVGCAGGSVVAMLAIGASTNVALLVAIIAFSLIHFAIQPLANKLLASYTTETYRGKIYGLAFFVSFGLSAFSPALLGRLGERLGIEAIFFALAGILSGGAILAVALMLYARRRPAIADV